MGLPMWQNSECRSPIKADATAPSRSPIRRRRVSHPRRRDGHTQRSPRISDHRPHGDAISFSRINSRPLVPPPPAPESRSFYRLGEASRERALDEYNRGRWERFEQFLAENPLDTVSERRRRPAPAFTPNFAPAGASRSANPEYVLPREDWIEDPRYLLHPGGSRSASPRTETASLPRIIPGSMTRDNDETGEQNAVGFPPLRRMGRRTIADGPLPSSSLRESWSPVDNTLDGLGDRERSFSPPVDDHWETMLTTVVSDPIAPTAESSFASAAASASFSNSHPSSRAGSSNSNSAASSRTHLTVPSPRHSADRLYAHACESSDSDTASDTEDEDEDRYRRREIDAGTRQARRTSTYPTLPPPPEPLRYSRNVRELSRDASAYVQNFISRNTPREENNPSERTVDGPVIEEEPDTLDQELRDARAILERLVRREDVGDEFWASVGLSRPLADVQQPEES